MSSVKPASSEVCDTQQRKENELENVTVVLFGKGGKHKTRSPHPLPKPEPYFRPLTNVPLDARMASDKAERRNSLNLEYIKAISL
jgi:hypothetical protein